jgi:hypothetical protein
MPRHIKRTASAAGALVIALLAGAIALTTNTPSTGAATTINSTTSAPAAPTLAPAEISADAAETLSQLEQLVVAEADDQDSYQRDEFGQRWADIDRNGCDQRNDALAAALENITTKPGTHDCVVLTGTLHDPYTGLTIAFQRGQGTSELVQVDHFLSSSALRDRDDRAGHSSTRWRRHSSCIERSGSLWQPPILLGANDEDGCLSERV